MIKNKILLFVLLSISTVIQAVHNKPSNILCRLSNSLVYCKHAQESMKRRKIEPEDVERVVFTTDIIKKGRDGRYIYLEKNNTKNPLKVILIESQSMVITAFRDYHNEIPTTLNQKFQDMKNQKRKREDR